MNRSIAVITGVSHDHGIGAAVCKQLAEEGHDVFFTCFQADEQWAEEFRIMLESFGVKSQYAAVDLSESHAAFSLLDRVIDTLGFPTVIVNNAAYSTRDGFAELDAESLDAHYAVNMRSTFLLCTEFARRYETLGKKKGKIVNLTSGQNQGPMIGELAYASTKGAIAAFTITLAAELARLGINVNAVNPGPTDTGWMTEAIKEELRPKFLSGRIGVPEDAAKLIGFLVRDEADWITGQVINSEGGFLRK